MNHLYIIPAVGIYSEISGLTAQLTRQDLKGMLNQMNQMKAEIHSIIAEQQATKDDLEATKAELQLTKTELQTTKDQLASKTRDVAFQVFLNNTQDIQKDVPVIFDRVHYNAGDCYNTSTGKFTAPVSGTYMFHAQTEIYTGNRAQAFTVSIVQSGSDIGAGYAATSEDTDDKTASATAITSVTKGEQVWVNITHASQIYADDWPVTVFSGAVLSAH